MTCPRCNDTGAVVDDFCSCDRGFDLWVHIQGDPKLRREWLTIQYFRLQLPAREYFLSEEPAELRAEREAKLEQLRFEIDDHIN